VKEHENIIFIGSGSSPATLSKRFFFLLAVAFFLTAPFSAAAYTTEDGVRHFFPDKHDLFLSGSPKKVTPGGKREITTDEFNGCLFDETGRLIRAKNCSPLAGLVLKEFLYKDGKPYSVALVPNPATEPGIKVIAYSSTGRPSKVLVRDLDRDWSQGGKKSINFQEFLSSVGIVLIDYEGSSQKHESFIKVDGEIVKAGTELYEFNDRGALKASCRVAGPGNLSSCDDDLQLSANPLNSRTDYGPNGPTFFESGVRSVTYQYRDGLLVEEQEKYLGSSELISNGEIFVTKYRDYRVDACGNWTRRFVLEQRSGREFLRTRKISYYKDCK